MTIISYTIAYRIAYHIVATYGYKEHRIIQGHILQSSNI